MLGRSRFGSKQSVVGIFFTSAGALALIAALLRDKGALTMSPGLEGSLTAGIVGLALALLGGVGYMPVAVIALPIFLAQYLGCRGSGEPSLAMLGMESLLIGLAGVALPAGSAAEDRARPAEAAKHEAPVTTPSLLSPSLPRRASL